MVQDVVCEFLQGVRILAQLRGLPYAWKMFAICGTTRSKADA